MMITSFFAAQLGLLLLLISYKTIVARKTHKISLGHGANNEILSLVSAHSNFVAYSPIFLVLLGLAEVSGLYSIVALYVLGFFFLLGRVFHFVAFSSSKINFKLRISGMLLTLIPIAIASFMNFYVFIKLNY